SCSSYHPPPYLHSFPTRRSSDLLAWLTSRFLVAILSTGPSQVVFDLTPSWHVLGFTSAVAIATGVLFGLAPAFQITAAGPSQVRSEEHTSELQSRGHLVCRLLLE